MSQNLDSWVYEAFNTAVEEMIDAYITESVKHFLSHSASTIGNEPRWFMENELELFKEQYVQKGGNLEDLTIAPVYYLDEDHVGPQYKSGGKILEWEVSRKRYHDRYKLRKGKRCVFWA